MRVLMFGWEFPPHISGGLGTACEGLVYAMLRQSMEVLFVVPKACGDEETNDFKLLSAGDVAVSQGMRKYKNKFNQLAVSSALAPYTSPELFAQKKEIETIEESQETSHFSFSGSYGHDLFEEVTNYAAVAAQLAADQMFDVIHAHDWLTFPAGLTAKEVSGKPLVIHVHATEFDRSGENVNQGVFETELAGMTGADHIIAVSELTKKTIVNRYRIEPEKISVVHNGVRPRALPRAGKKIKDKIVSFLGRVTFQKGPEYFVLAAHQVLQRFPHVQFVMAGNGDKLEDTIRLAARLGMGSHFHFTGFLRGDDVNTLLSQTDLYVMPSVSEPFGISPLEAIQVDVPVIISKQSGVSEVLHHAIKVDFWDVEALADAIHGVLVHKPLSQTLSRGAAIEVKSVTWDAAARKIIDIYHQL
jgi:glycogen synthase